MPKVNSKKSKMAKYFLPYDIYERHRKIGSLIEKDDTVLDVGGELDQLANFCKASKIVVANLEESQEKSDVVIKKGELPFSKGSFKTVCAIDVLEHIPKNEREKFIKSLFDICTKKVVLSFPIGTLNHTRYEKELSNWLKSKGKDVKYLEEHIAYGLPTHEDVTKLTKGTKSKISFSGSLTLNNFLFKLHTYDPNIKFVRKITYAIKLLFNFLTNPILYKMNSEKKYSENVIRAYIVLEK